MKKAVFIGIVVVCLVIIQSLMRSIYSLWHKRELYVNAQKELEVREEENKKLKSQLQYVKSPEFIEEQARNKLFMVKEGEQEIVIPKELLVKAPEPTKPPPVPNWKQWVNLFF